MRIETDRSATRSSAPARPGRIALLVATSGGVGSLPLAPGTWGSLVGLGLDRALALAGVGPVAWGAFVVATTLVGTWAAARVERAVGEKDPSVVVVDEVAGMLLTLYLVPVGWTGAAVGFVLFRLFDVVKPFPCRRAESLAAGVGIMADDLIAALYAQACLRLALVLAPAALGP